MTGLRFQNLCRRFPGSPEIATGDLSFGPGITVLFGPSGAGKTTLLNCAAGLDRPDAGAVLFGEEGWSDATRRIFVPPRLRRIGLVPQSYALFPHLTVEENIGYGLFALDQAEQAKRIAETIFWLDLSGLQRRLPHELSGGQRQRVALGRALAPRPRLLLLDEPLSALDAPTRDRLRGELRAFLVQAAIPALLVTHDPKEAAMLGDDVVLLDEGKVLQHGPVGEVFNHPATPAAARIVGSDTLIEGQVEQIAGGMARVRAGEASFLAPAGDLPAETRLVFVSIQSGDVSLALYPGKNREEASLSGLSNSPRNRLPGIIRRIGDEGYGPLVHVEVDCGLPGGLPLKALLTREAQADLALRPGLPVIALVKAPRIHLMPRG